MTRSRRSPRSLAAMFGVDPSAAVLRVLREAGRAVTAIEIKQVLGAAGVPSLDKRAWDRLQRRLRTDDHVVIEPGYRYRWVADPVTPPAAQAFEQVARAAGGRVKLSHVELVRHTLADTADAREVAAGRRQAFLDGVRALAELAIEVEELATNQASARALIHRVRSRLKHSGLEPIERAGDVATFDRRRHESIGPPIDDGAKVMVMRPGYAWRATDEDVLVARAVVSE